MHLCRATPASLGSFGVGQSLQVNGELGVTGIATFSGNVLAASAPSITPQLVQIL